MTIQYDFNRRITERLTNYWLYLRGDRGMPQEKDLNLNDIKDPLDRDSTFVVELTDSFSYGGYRYSFMGKNLLEAFGANVDFNNIDSIISLPNSSVKAKFDAAVASRKPFADEGEFINADNVTIKYRQILLPLASNKDPKELAFLFGGMHWRAY